MSGPGLEPSQRLLPQDGLVRQPEAGKLGQTLGVQHEIALGRHPFKAVLAHLTGAAGQVFEGQAR
ncbi:hypothetical protein [Microvirga sp. KLBC 81]|uniref:hypothetical protein n=1 Tax=Microvirga sp. KLBC 81 TaxID=1862707 RepID=UPI001057640C|nr:hypothetical protein [Microvirga sp. KLBC 81]